ncbi:MAG: thioredoxin domain-containing protein, partial [Candidatus Eisenbacteria bacterium]|nr:thioredoxin domain-containing protein [Candidatus Eisenbacteria bacterium]
MASNPTGANRLIDETSPYLLQHAHNPVDWYPWGEPAFEKARAEDKPIFLSVGYAACHWCHVMEHESFEDPEIAALMNEHFVNVKVDREERPDVDDIYMAAVQMITGQGGWPMSVFLTPDLRPFYAGTYFPPDDRYGRPGFPKILQAMAHAYRERRDEVDAGATQLVAGLARLTETPDASGEPDRDLLRAAAEELAGSFDAVNGGFGAAPKFPHATGLQLLLRVAGGEDRRPVEMVTRSLDRMAAGGIYDHLGGGFHRYSVDARWLVPHFEKMLYDQALLVLAYVEGWQVTGNPEYARVVAETIGYVLRDLRDPAGGFYSSEDADSEGVEGKFYVWTLDEIRALLDEDEAALFLRAYDVDEVPNFEEGTILQRRLTAEQLIAGGYVATRATEIEAILARARAKLFAARSRRVRPGRDEKILTAWNGFMISALARAGRALDDADYREAATRAAEFVWTRVRVDGILHRVHKDGRTRIPGYLEDYAAMTLAFVDLYEATFDLSWLER